MHKPILVRKNFIKDLVIVSGTNRSGKKALCRIISSLNRAENMRLNYLMEQFAPLNYFGLMPDETAVYLMRFALNFMRWNNFISREVNFRLSDHTSVWRTKDPMVYLKRLLIEDKQEILRNIKEANPIFVLMVHDMLWHAKIHFKAFPNLKVVNMVRNPADTVLDWYDKGYCRKGKCDELYVASLTLKGINETVPDFAYAWKEAYEKMSRMDRIIFSVQHLKYLHQCGYDSLSKKEQERVLFVPFEKFVVNPRPFLHKIYFFLKTEPTLYTNIVLAEESCPRSFTELKKGQSLKRIKRLASRKAFKQLLSMEEKYVEDEYT